MNILRATLLALTGMLLGILTTALGQIQPGYHREDVFRVLGSPDYSGRMGQTETLSYKNGTKILLSNGVVQEVSVPGQIRIGNNVKIIEVARAPQPNMVTDRAAKPAGETKAASAKTKTPESVAQPTIAANASGVSNGETEASATNKAAATTPSVATVRSTPTAPTVAEIGGFIANIKKIIASLLLVFVGVLVVMYGFTCFCFKLICEKAGKPGGALVWIPIAQFIPLLRVADMREWMVALLLIPVVNIGFTFMLWARICTARGKSPWLVLMMLVPVANLFFIPYLAFAAANAQSAEAPVVSPTTETSEAAQTTEMAEANATTEVTEENLSDTPFAEMPDPSAPVGSASETPSQAPIGQTAAA